MPLVLGRAVVTALMKVGYYVARQRGSHVQMKHSVLKSLTVPVHNKPVKKGLLHSILKNANLSVEEFLELL